MFAFPLIMHDLTNLAVLLGSICSFLAIAPWWNAVVPGARFGAIFDIGVILALLVFGEQIAAL